MEVSLFGPRASGNNSALARVADQTNKKIEQICHLQQVDRGQLIHWMVWGKHFSARFAEACDYKPSPRFKILRLSVESSNQVERALLATIPNAARLPICAFA
jgi:hypothetical protein